MRRASVALTLAIAATGAVASTTGSARANGRFPAAGQVVIDPGDPQHIVIRATYGVLQTTDGGDAWRWICEQSVGYGGVEDPAMGITADGTLLAGIFEGLAVSADRGCTWAFAPDPLTDQYVIDVAVEAADPSRAVAITSTGSPTGFNVILAETLDSGATWTQAGASVDKTLLAATVEVAPSAPDRVYVSGLFGADYEGAIARTDDRGETWTILPFDLKGGTGVFIGAVDPADPDRLWARVDGPDQDILYVSADGAQTWSDVATTPGEMLGFALSPDGKDVAIGGPDVGLLVASTADHVFAKAAAVQVKCLRWHKSGLYACTDEFKDGFTLGRSADRGKTFDPLYHLADLLPLECAAGTPTATNCPANWPAVANAIGVDLSGSGGGGGAGTGGAPADPEPDGSGCACALAQTALPTGASSWWALVAAVALLRRRARR